MPIAVTTTELIEAFGHMSQELDPVPAPAADDLPEGGLIAWMNTQVDLAPERFVAADGLHVQALAEFAAASLDAITDEHGRYPREFYLAARELSRAYSGTF